MKKLSTNPRYKLNAVCPYYTMFPLEFPMGILKRFKRDTIVLDPFCGRGTTNFASQVLGFKSYGIDTSPIAVAITKAKLSKSTIADVITLAKKILKNNDIVEVPKGDFWQWAFHPDTLYKVCQLRSELLNCTETDEAIILRAIALGCLHGPVNKDIKNPSYFSNQMPRTFSPKPQYSVKYWEKHNLKPFPIDILYPIKKKTRLVLNTTFQNKSTPNNIFCGDSQKYNFYREIKEKVDLVITSPPYYGMRTYITDQWLRNWFLGGPDAVDYSVMHQVDHFSPNQFAKSLSKVWDNIYNISSDSIRLVIRFGKMPSKKADHEDILIKSFQYSAANWKIYYRRNADNADRGRRQADIMGDRIKSSAINETDYFVRLD